ncbi:leukotriene B4 receptor 1-like [Anguilla anguilla]|uniref:leukotriene B4 receptor 1-like n=1 Tax=Anguilla anguilla TaxID=7936 RepID=UPI0015AAB805|nr:leukotriene B4 receptor 1-like [Anguilla anguilla]
METISYPPIFLAEVGHKMNSSRSFGHNETVVDQWETLGRPIACVILALSFLVGAPGNLLVIWTILRHVKRRSHTVVLILHLAAADLLVLVTLPLWIYSFAHSWVFGEAACKAMVYIINSCMYSSVFLITAMSVERFVAVRYPFRLMSLRRKEMMNKLLIAIWILAFLFGIPTILSHCVGELSGTQQCLFQEHGTLGQELAILLLETLVGFVIPFLILITCYSLLSRDLKQLNYSSKQKTAILINSVVIAFAVCWLPYHVLNLVSFVSSLTEKSNEVADFLQSGTFISGALAFISSSANPVLYAFAAKSFQGSLRESGLLKLFQEIATHTHKTKGTASSSLDKPNGVDHIEQMEV